MDWIRAKIATKKIYGQLRIKLKKFTAKNIKKKTLNSGDSNWLKTGGIEEKLNFNGQLRINLYKSKTKDQNKKGTKIWD
jgi:hypothetical protein